MSRARDLADDFFEDDDRSFSQSLDQFKPKSDFLLESAHVFASEEERSLLNFTVGSVTRLVSDQPDEQKEDGIRKIKIKNCTDKTITHYRLIRGKIEEDWEPTDTPIPKNCDGPCPPAKDCEAVPAFSVPFSNDPDKKAAAARNTFGIKLRLEDNGPGQAKFDSGVYRIKLTKLSFPPVLCVDSSNISPT